MDSIYWFVLVFISSQEEQAMQAIRKVVGDPLGMELYELWKEYEELKTVEAIYCKASQQLYLRGIRIKLDACFLEETQLCSARTSTNLRWSSRPSSMKKSICSRLIRQGDNAE